MEGIDNDVRSFAQFQSRLLNFDVIQACPVSVGLNLHVMQEMVTETLYIDAHGNPNLPPWGNAYWKQGKLNRSLVTY